MLGARHVLESVAASPLPWTAADRRLPAPQVRHDAHRPQPLAGGRKVKSPDFLKICIHFHAFYLKETEKVAFNCVVSRKPKSVKKSGMYFQNFEFENLEFWVHPMQNRG